MQRVDPTLTTTEITVYSPDSAIVRPVALVRGMWQDLLASRGLAWRLAVRDISAQYRASYLGYVWAFATPILNTAVWVFLSMSGVVRVADTAIPYPAYVFTGTMLWQMFTESLSTPLGQVLGAKSMLAKLNFPRESLILAGIYKVLFSALIKCTILVPVVFFFGVQPDLHILLLPMAVVALVLAGTAIGLLLAPVGVLYTDIGRIIPLATQLLMYLTPVVFAMPKAGLMAKVFELNPTTPLILTGRAWLTGTEITHLPEFLLVSASSAALLFIAWVFYRITMAVLVERMSS